MEFYEASLPQKTIENQEIEYNWAMALHLADC